MDRRYRRAITLTRVAMDTPVIELVGLHRRRHAVRVRVRRGSEWIDITNHVASGVITETNNTPVATLDLRLLNDPRKPSLAPRVKDSPYNLVNGQYMPLLDRYNEIVVEAAVSPDGSEPTEFVPRFGGYLGDRITTVHDSAGNVYLQITARDYAKQLMDDYIIGPIEFRNMWASEIIQELLDQRHQEGHLPEPIQLRVLGEDDFWVEEVAFQHITTWEAIQTFARQSNKDIRYLLDETTNTFRLTYWTPSTEMVPGWVAETKDIRREELDVTDADNRYRVTIRWRASNGTVHETTVERLNKRKPNEPIREALIEEGHTTLIKTEADALRLANAIVEGLSSSPATDRLLLPFSPYLRIHDVILVKNPGVRSEAETFAIEELRLRFDARNWDAEVVGRESVALRPRYWLSIESKRGAGAPIPPEAIGGGNVVLPAPNITVTPVTNGLVVDVLEPPIHPARWATTMVQVSNGQNFAPGATIVATEKSTYFTFDGLDGGTTYYVRAAYIDIAGARGPFSPTESAVPIQPYVPDTTPPEAPTLEPLVPRSLDLGAGRYDISVEVPFTVGERAEYVVFERREGTSGGWQEVGRATRSPFIDRGGLKTQTTYQYRARAVSPVGVESSLSNVRQTTIPAPTVVPPNVTGLTADFTGRDALVRWNPVSSAVRYRVQVLSGTNLRREVVVTDNAYTYRYEDNASDGTPVPNLTFRVWAVNQFGNESLEPSQVNAVNPAPSAPSVELASSLSQLRWHIMSPLPSDFKSITVTAGAFSTTTTATIGVIDLSATGYKDASTATVHVIVTDVFNQNSQPTQATAIARYLTPDDMAGALFEIVAEATDLNGNPKAPTSGSLENLWDNNTDTGASWAQGPVRITFKYPMVWFFDMARLWSQTTRAYYVEVRTQQGQWVQVTAQENAAAQAWTIRRFNDNRLYAARELRITFPGSAAVDLRELKFWTVTLADEILAEVLRLTGSMEILNADGSVKLDAQGLKVAMTDGHKIDLTKDGLTMTPAGFSHPGMILTGYALQFWDKDKNPSIGIGDVRDMAAQLGSDMEYGLLLAQGEIRASQSVLSNSLIDYSVTSSVLAPGSVLNDKLPDRVVTLPKLNEAIHVVQSAFQNVQRYASTSTRSTTLSGTGWHTLVSFSVPKYDAQRGLLMEICRWKTDIYVERNVIVEVQFLVNGSTVSTVRQGIGTINYELLLDFRSRPLGDHTFTIRARVVDWLDSDPLTGTRVDAFNIYIFQNDQLPLRPGLPAYSVQAGVPSGCFTACETTCETSAEIPCPSCESSCQTDCESACQATCETTSQGGGGCIREGTPITIWDPDIQAYREVPVEQLKPGMILPGYNPETDTLEHGELIRLEDAKFSDRFLRIYTDNGPSVDVTYTQPFDVLADMGDGWRWYRLHAKFLQPGMKMVRPFEEGDRRFSTITQVEHIRENMVHFWNPKVSNDRYLAAGYADWVTK